jgi:SPP1 family predicted phage head-tail adaptor
MRSGTLRFPVRFLKPPPVDNAYGEPTVTGPMDLEGATQFHRCWAAIEGLRTQEADVMARNLSEAIYDVRIRYVEGITPDMVIHVENDGRVFAILGVQDREGRRRELHINAKEVTGLWTASTSV